VLATDGQVRGFGVVKANLIDLLMIDHDFHRQGYGTLLLRYLEEQLFREYDELTLESFEDNDKANCFYRKSGWIEQGRAFDEMIGVYKLVFVKDRV
jgi:ribosomal protein S18 acetylase RimI-like enzyme